MPQHRGNSSVLGFRRPHPSSSIRSSATLAQCFTLARTWMRLTTRPSTRFSSAQARCCGLMRYMVVQRQPVSSSVMMLLAFGGKAAGHAVDQVNLRADGKYRSRRRLLDQRDQPLGGAQRVGLLADLPAALGMHDDLDAGILGAHLIDVAGQKALMHGAVALPQKDAAGGELCLRLAALQSPTDPTPPSPRAECPSRSRCCGPGAGRAERESAYRAQRPTRRPRGRWTRCRPARRARRRRP